MRAPSNLLIRVATALVGIPLVLAVNYAGGALFAVLVGLTAVVGTVEIIGLFKAGGYRPLSAIMVAFAVAFAVLPALHRNVETPWLGMTVLLLGLSGARYLAPTLHGRGLVNWGLTLMGAIYVGLLLGHLTLLRQLPGGAWWIALVLLMTWAYDTGAYFSGRLLGRHPFMPHISPRKTREGVLGGLLLSSVAGLCGVPALGIIWWQALLLGTLTGVVAQIGDLVESMIKRQVSVKDSGTIIPGHGGLLDRIDSLLFTGALGYYAALVLGHAA